MKKHMGYYSILQYCPQPERMEFVNIGLFVFYPDSKKYELRFSENLKRVEKLFRGQNPSHFKVLKEAFSSRLDVEFSSRISREYINIFARKRANELRMTDLKPFSSSCQKADADMLFQELIGEERSFSRQPSAKSKLKKHFKKMGVLNLLDIKPEPIKLPEIPMEIKVPYGYQNGSYNLIDPVRLNHEDIDEAIKEAGKRELAGRWLSKHFANSVVQKRLVIVGDFQGQEDSFYRNIKEIMDGSNIRIYRMDELKPLISDIREHAALN